MPLTKDEADRLIGAIRGVMDPAGVKAHYIDPAVKSLRPAVDAHDRQMAAALPLGMDFEKLYQAIKARFIDDARIDPVLLQILTQRPKLEIEVEPRTIALDGASLKGRVGRLLAAGWFDNGRRTGAVRSELTRTGPDPGGGGNLAAILAELVRDGFLVREGEGWKRAAGVEILERTIAAT